MGKITGIIKQTQNRFLNLYELRTIKKTGAAGRYFVSSRAEREEDLKIRTRKDTADGVMMTMLYGEKADRLVLIRQYRFPLDDFIYELPAGLAEKGESVRECAVREVYEETGLTFRPLDVDPAYERPFYTTVGMTDEAVSLVYGYASGEISDAHLEASEEIQVVLADRTEAARILKEERLSIEAAEAIMHFIHDREPFAFLKASLPD